jgi:hypothetical protein
MAQRSEFREGSEMNSLPPILARDYAINRVRATGCFFAFGAVGTALGRALLLILGVLR